MRASKSAKESPKTTLVAYDQSLLQMTDGTNVLFADGHVEFLKHDRLKALGIAPGQKLKVVRGDKAYAAQLPEQWKPYVSAGKLTVIGSPFYGVRCKKWFAAWPHVRIRWSFKNLTSEPVELNVEYKAIRTTGGGATGHSMWYRLGPNEHRLIDDIIPVMTAKAPVTLYVMARELRQTRRKVETPSRHRLVTTDPLPPTKLPPNNIVVKDPKAARVVVKGARLAYSQAKGNVLELDVVNRTDKELPLVVYAAAGDTDHGDKALGKFPETGLFVETTETVKPNSESVVRLPYSVPVTGPDPSLVFTLFEREPDDKWLPADALQAHSDLYAHLHITPVCWGWFNLPQAADQGLAKLPDYVPVGERAKLTAQKRSKHFLFRYRPNSYAERHIDTAIKDREEAYQRLSSVLRMELSEAITIDLYPDMEAKGLGSRTWVTPANTVTNTHIAEVYNQNYQCDRYHELAHIFSYHFPGFGPEGSGTLIQPFAEYFEAGTVRRIDSAREGLKRELAQDTVKPLAEVLLLSNSSRAPVAVFIDFLIRKDIEDFKKFFARVGSQVKTPKDLDKACREIYSVSLKELEQQWHKYLRESQDATEVDKKSTAKQMVDGPAEAQKHAVMKAFKNFQRYLEEEKYKAAWGLLAKTLRSQSGGFEKWKAQASGGGRTVFLNIRPESVAKYEGGAIIVPTSPNAEILVLRAKCDNQAWKLFFVKEGSQWTICEAQVDRGR